MEGLLLLLAVVAGAVLGAAFGIAFGATATGILIGRGRGRPGAERRNCRNHVRSLQKILTEAGRTR